MAFIVFENKHMEQAYQLAEKALKEGEVPIGAVIIDAEGKIIASASNKTEQLQDPTAHAEILAIKEACKNKQNKFLNGCKIFVTLEPCPMCAQALSNSKIEAIYYGAADAKSGGIENGARVLSASSCHHKPEIYSGLLEKKCSDILKKFFKELR